MEKEIKEQEVEKEGPRVAYNIREKMYFAFMKDLAFLFSAFSQGLTLVLGLSSSDSSSSF